MQNEYAQKLRIDISL